MADTRWTGEKIKFCQHVAEGMTQLDAYKISYNPKTSNKKTITEAASRLCTDPLIIGRIAELKKAINDQVIDRLAITKERLLKETASIALFDPRGLYDSEGRLLPITKWPDHIAANIKSIEVAEIGNDAGIVTKVQFWDKPAALEKLFKHKGLYAEDNAQKNPVLDSLKSLPPAAKAILIEKLNKDLDSKAIDGEIIPNKDD